ncbi:MAG: beta-lactamase regulating signal transducer with metallopeptidase domain [Verrucomicrobiales bacterium]|jgi:beta-lactamase regulating signal transducer with metallopeptidase domain
MIEDIVLRILAYTGALSILGCAALLALPKVRASVQSTVLTVLLLGFLWVLVQVGSYYAFSHVAWNEEGDTTVSSLQATLVNSVVVAEAPVEWGPWLVYAGWIWFVGGAISAVIVLIQVWRLLRVVQRAVPLSTMEMEKLRQGMSADMLAKGLPPLMVSSEVKAPCCTGICRPVILLPSGIDDDSLSVDDVRMILRHELAHIDHNDLVILALQRLAQVIYWWNPIVHLLIRRISVVHEELCDCRVIEVEPSYRYAQFLLNAGKLWGEQTELTLAVSRSYKDLKRRIDRVLASGNRTTNLRGGWRLAIITVCVFVVSAMDVGTSGVTLKKTKDVRMAASQMRMETIVFDRAADEIARFEVRIVSNPDLPSGWDFNSVARQSIIGKVRRQMPHPAANKIVYAGDRSPKEIQIMDDPSMPRRQVEELHRASPELYNSVPEVRRLLNR